MSLNQQPESEESPQARYPAPPLPSAPSDPAQPEKTTVSRIEQVQIAASGEKKHPFIYSNHSFSKAKQQTVTLLKWKSLLSDKKIMICCSVIRGFSQTKAPASEITVSDDKTTEPDSNFLGGRKLLGNMKSIQSLKQSGLSGVFTGQAVSAKKKAFSFSKSFPFFSLKFCVCAEQDGGPAHRGGQPVGHRLPGAHSRRERPSHR